MHLVKSSRDLPAEPVKKTLFPSCTSLRTSSCSGESTIVDWGGMSGELGSATPALCSVRVHSTPSSCVRSMVSHSRGLWGADPSLSDSSTSMTSCERLTSLFRFGAGMNSSTSMTSAPGGGPWPCGWTRALRVSIDRVGFERQFRHLRAYIPTTLLLPSVSGRICADYGGISRSICLLVSLLTRARITLTFALHYESASNIVR